MKKHFTNDFLIQQIYNSYKQKYGMSLPEINNIKYIERAGFWARFQAEDLYNKRYILYVNQELIQTNKKFVKQVLYHEFTHLADSIRYLQEPFEKFRNVMSTYSEFNSSRIEMIERIEQVQNEPIDLKSEIIHVGILTIESFIEQSFELMKKDLKKMSDNTEDFWYNISHIYYYYGYIKALESFGIEYKTKTYLIPSKLMLEVTAIQNILLNDIVDIDALISAQLKLDDSIKRQYILKKMINR